MADNRAETLAYLMEEAVETSIPRDIRIITGIVEEAGEVMGAFNKWCETPARASATNLLQEMAQLQIVLDLAILRYGNGGQFDSMLNTEWERQIDRFREKFHGRG